MEATKKRYQKHKTERKIAIEYKLNTNIKKNKDSALYPIYIEIRVRGKKNNIKSRINEFVSETSFNNYLLNSKFMEYVNYEKEVIENSIKQLDPNNNHDFDLTQWYKYYSQDTDNYSKLDYLIFKGFVNMICEKLKQEGSIEHYADFLFENHLSKAETDFAYIESILKMFSKLNFAFADEMLKRYDEIFYNFYHLNPSVHDGFMIEFDFCLIDWKTGFFQQQFSKIYKNKLFVLDLISEIFTHI